MQVKAQRGINSVIGKMMQQREDRFAKLGARFGGRQCGFCGEHAFTINTNNPICEDCIVKLNSVPIKVWKTMKQQAFADKDMRKYILFKQLFKFRRAGFIIGLHPLPTLKLNRSKGQKRGNR